MPEWLKNRFCAKCQGEGWVWAHELSKWHGEGSPMTDDTKYRCDDACHFEENEPGYTQYTGYRP
jgi:hypothetical protein